jgi:hypothetical protein
MERRRCATTSRVESANYESLISELPLPRTTEAGVFVVVFLKDLTD